MLVLTRRPGEKILIGPDIEVAILGVEGNRVRIGVKAPESTPVHRAEVAERIAAEHGGESPMGAPRSGTPS